jgi:drug/metabolite transporter (DMT)-like permease
MSNLDLIDWRLVGFSALWLGGLSVILAAFSFGDYTASQRRLRTRAVLAWPGYQAAFNGGLVLFCLGLMGSAFVWWQQALWAVLAVAFGYQTWAAWRRRTRPAAPSK